MAKATAEMVVAEMEVVLVTVMLDLTEMEVAVNNE